MNASRIQQGLCILVMTMAFPSVAPASVIFTNFGPGLTYNTMQGNQVGNGLNGHNYGEASTFVPAVTAAFGSVTVALSCVVGCPAPSTFSIVLSPDNDNLQPGPALETFNFVATTLGGIGNNNPPIVANSVLHPLLQAGTRYWISVVSSSGFVFEWNLNSTGDTAPQAVRDNGFWSSPSSQLPGAFQVDSAASTPEPAAALLLASGVMLGILLYYRR